MKLMKSDLRKDINELSDNTSSFKTDLSSLKEYTNQLADYYQSNEATKYIEKLKLYLIELDKLANNFEYAISYLNGVISVYDELDQSFESKKPI